MNEPVLQADGLSVGYESRTVLTDVSFAVRPSELVGLIGANGAGKSTLLKTVRGLLAPLGGTVALLGTGIQSLSPRAFAQRAAYLSQQTEIPFGYTVRDIAMTGRYPYLGWWQREGGRDRALVDASLAYVGMTALADRPMQELSGGQRQRALFAKVLAQQTPVLLLDEPATGLDLMYQEELFRFCQELCAAGRTVLMVVHELGLAARFCSRLLLFGGGHLLADGTPADVLTPARLTAAYDAPIAVDALPNGHYDVYVAKRPERRERQALLERMLDSQTTASLSEGGGLRSSGRCVGGRS
ncbi:ABC transporter ATP-binding protein [Selenomonas sp.]|uniref:ABC transporter ATP-binding protein n=2 Tax=Selenomonas sp. TaxID=2053611 RepID=UPI0025E15C83|nr:ABC transporter ATP-binding protein [Selenomonas sp.]MCI6283393.1 ABC transporter ATP-binding protein [Selenomonas sp.]